MNIYLSGRGRSDITREAFGNKQPMEFDIGAPIRKLTIVSWPAAQSVVEDRAEGTRLLVGPGLISRRQDLRFTVITGREPRAIPPLPLLPISKSVYELATRQLICVTSGASIA